MNPNEEYLDNLLKSMSDTENSNRTMTAEEIEAMFAAAEEPEVSEEPVAIADSVTAEDTADMTQEDIERLLEQAIAESEKMEEPAAPEGESEELDEINELLRKADNDEAVGDDVLALLEGIGEEDILGQESSENPDEDISIEEIPEKKKREKKKAEKNIRKKKNGKKNIEDEGQAEEQIKEKKQGMFSKIVAFWTEEDEEEETQTGGELASNSEENEAILKELNREDKSAKRKKKKKGKKEQNVEADELTDDEAEIKEKKKKEKKAPKVKKEKKEKPEEAAAPGKKVSAKKIILISVICFLVMVILLICCVFLSKSVDVRAAKKAFYQEDYTQCYQLLYGKDLNESETIIFEKAEVLLSMERRLDSYENYLLMGKELEALDSLIQAPKTYDNLQKKAAELDISSDLTAVYEQILKELDTKYQVSEEKARELAGYGDTVKYTEELGEIIEAQESLGAGNEAEPEQKPMEDVLPREEELGDFNFIQ